MISFNKYISAVLIIFTTTVFGADKTEEIQTRALADAVFNASPAIQTSDKAFYKKEFTLSNRKLVNLGRRKSGDIWVDDYLLIQVWKKFQKKFSPPDRWPQQEIPSETLFWKTSVTARGQISEKGLSYTGEYTVKKLDVREDFSSPQEWDHFYIKD